jgi:hypothetical protein
VGGEHELEGCADAIGPQGYAGKFVFDLGTQRGRGDAEDRVESWEERAGGGSGSVSEKTDWYDSIMSEHCLPLDDGIEVSDGLLS